MESRFVAMERQQGVNIPLTPRELCTRIVRHTEHDEPDLAQVDLLGRMPVPVRRAFKLGLDRLLEREAARNNRLACCFLSGGEWYRPFDTLARCKHADEVPAVLLTTLQEDILSPELLSFYRSRASRVDRSAIHPAFASSGLIDPSGLCRTFAAVPFVLLVDRLRLRGRPIPQTWTDLLAPHWQKEIVFGGWRPNESVAYKDFNSYLLLFMLREFGTSGLEAFATNVSHLQHNVRTTTLFGTNSHHASTIAVLPWLHAEMCPRRMTTCVVWPKDGALAMPIVHLVKPERQSRVAPLIDYVTGCELGRVLNRNCYPTLNVDANHLPLDASFRWLGWQYVYTHDLVAESHRAVHVFFSALNRREMQACA